MFNCWLIIELISVFQGGFAHLGENKCYSLSSIAQQLDHLSRKPSLLIVPLLPLIALDVPLRTITGPLCNNAALGRL